MQLMPPTATPYAPQMQQSQMLAQALAAMRAQQQNATPIGGSANMVANALNTFGQQGAGQGGQNQWTGVNGQPSGNWLDSPLGSQVGGMFGLGKIAQGNQLAQGVANGASTPLPDGAGQIAGMF